MITAVNDATKKKAITLKKHPYAFLIGLVGSGGGDSL
jgi:hypothetical protein